MLRVNEIFLSVSGEVGLIPQGAWTVFIRLAGCNLRCRWCDTSRSWKEDPEGKDLRTEQEVLAEVLGLCQGFEAQTAVLITGGEPLRQNIGELCGVLKDFGIPTIQVETNGSISPAEHLRRHVDCFVFDYKLPSSGMEENMLPAAEWWGLPRGSFVKFVVASPADFKRAELVVELLATCRAPGVPYTPFFRFAFSATPPLVSHNDLFQWMKGSAAVRRFGVTLNVQIHKAAALVESKS